MKKNGDGRELSVWESVSAFAAELFGNAAEALHEKGQDLADSRRRKQYERIFSRELRKLLALHMPFFHGYRFSAVLCAMIMGLQLISANTTYAGTWGRACNSIRFHRRGFR